MNNCDKVTLYDLAEKYEKEMAKFSSPLSSLFEQSAIFVTDTLRTLNLETGISTIEINTLIANYVINNDQNKLLKAKELLLDIQSDDEDVQNVIKKVNSFFDAFLSM